MSTTRQSNAHLQLQSISLPPPLSTCANHCEERAAIRAHVDAANTEYVDYLKQMINSLLENQMSLSAALDETREACVQLNLQKSELEASSTQEVQVLQAELSMCRQREAEMTLAYEDLRSRVEAIDQVIEQIPWLDVLFNSDDPLATRLKVLKHQQSEGDIDINDDERTTSADNATLKTTPTNVITAKAVVYDADDQTGESDDGDVDEDDVDVGLDAEIADSDVPSNRRVPLSVWRRPAKRNGSASPLSDSGCTSESHDEVSLASLNSAQSSPHLAVLRGRLEAQQVKMRRPPQQQPQIKRSATSAIVGGGGWRLGRITESWKTSISRFVDKSEWKMEALAARQREARALVLLNETQAEVRKVESRCKGLSRRQNEQELRMMEKEKEIERLMAQERDLRQQLRNWQQRVFQLETEVQGIRHNYQIAELDMKSRLLEATISTADPTSAIDLSSTNPASLFSDDLFGLKVSDELSSSTTTTNVTSSTVVNTPVHEEAVRPAKFLRPSLAGIPRFASTTNLSRLHSVSPGLQAPSQLGTSRPASTLNLNQSPNCIEGSIGSGRPHGNILTTSLGSLSELELRADV